MPRQVDAAVERMENAPATRASHGNAIHLLRTMQLHHVSLSQMADQKANILIGVNSVVFALVVRETGEMSLPMMMLAATSAAAAILCMMAVVPSTGTPKKVDARPNLLFFGTFARMTEPEYLKALDDILYEDADIRDAMARDVYQLGTVLQRKKYRFLGLAYRVFIGGLAVTGITSLVIGLS